MDTVSAAAGIAGRDALFDLLDAAADRNPAAAIGVVDMLYQKSKDMQRLCDELIAQLRNVMLLHVTQGQTELLACMPEEVARLQQLTARLSLSEVLEKLALLQDCNERMTRAINKRVELELCLIRLCSAQAAGNPAQTLDNSEIYDKIKQLEQSVAAASQGSFRPIPKKDEVTEEPSEPKVDFSKLNPKDFKTLTNWAEVLAEFEKINPAVSGTLAGSGAFVNGNVMMIVVKNRMFMTLFKNKEHAVSLGDTIQRVLGTRFVIRAKCDAPKEQASMADQLLQRAREQQIETQQS